MSAADLNRSGRKAGSLNKFNKSIKDMILTALHDVGGAAYLARQAEQNPTAFLGLVGKVLPLQLAGADGGALIVDFRWADSPAQAAPAITQAPAPDAIDVEWTDSTC